MLVTAVVESVEFVFAEQLHRFDTVVDVRDFNGFVELQRKVSRAGSIIFYAQDFWHWIQVAIKVMSLERCVAIIST